MEKQIFLQVNQHLLLVAAENNISLGDHGVHTKTQKHIENGMLYLSNLIDTIKGKRKETYHD